MPKPFQILASGIDSLYLAIDVVWKDESFFERLTTMKKLAILEEKETAIVFRDKENQELWKCTIKPHGAKGHEWILVGSEFSMTIGNWLEPKSRPSILAQIHSEALWRLNPQGAVDFLLHLFTQSGAEIKSVKASRVDLCVDIIFPEDLWTMDLINYRVTRARYTAPHLDNNTLTGITIGKGIISARLYDKPLEIQQQSKKYWMYSIWNIEEVPEGQKIIRVEFQLRREAIKEVGLDSVSSLFESIENLWAYCTNEWLKFQTKGKHHTQRKTFDWWVIIQKAFWGVQDAKPLNRVKALNPKKKQLAAQIYGIATSLQAIEMEAKGFNLQIEATVKDVLQTIEQSFKDENKNDFQVALDVQDKRAKYHQSEIKALDVYSKRLDNGFLADQPIIDEILKKRSEKEQWKNTLQLKS